jgi:hypothetical protein
MATHVLSNNFSAGVLSPMSRRLVDTQVYNSSASVMENVCPLPTGGFRIRPGVRRILDLNIANGFKRIIPFSISESEYYIIALRPNYLSVIPFNGTAVNNTAVSTFASPYSTDEEIAKVRYAQDYEHLILVSEDYAPFIIAKNDKGWSVGNIVLDDKSEKYVKDTNGNKTFVTYDYDGLFTTEGNYPSCVTFCSNRLWFASSKNNPYRLWASRPFKWNNFQDVEYYETLDSTATVDDYLEAITGETEKITYFTDEALTIATSSEEEANYKLVTSKSADLTTGYQITTFTKYKKSSSSSGTQIVWTHVSTTSESTTFAEAKTSWREVITSDCAMILDVGSDRNDRICWIATNENIYVGTTSSEYMMYDSIDAQNPVITKISSYGSARKQPITGNSAIFYVQTGNRNIRMVTYDGYYRTTTNVETNANCKELFSHGIADIQWQRTPDQRMYCLLNDGTMNVFINDGGSISAWAHWSIPNEKIISVAVLDTINGQDAFVLTESGSLSILDKTQFYDTADSSESKIECKVVSNYIDSSTTIQYKKRAVRYWVDSMGTDFSVSQNGLTTLTPREINDILTPCTSYTSPSESFAFEISNPGKG